MNAQALVNTLSQQGFTLTPLPGNKLEIRPASRLTPELREKLKRHKPEILPLVEAMTWLRSQLSAGPKRIADLFFVWCAPVVGRPSAEIAAKIDLLNDSRWALNEEVYFGEDGRAWWRLEQEARKQ